MKNFISGLRQAFGFFGIIIGISAAMVGAYTLYATSLNLNPAFELAKFTNNVYNHLQDFGVVLLPISFLFLLCSLFLLGGGQPE